MKQQILPNHIKILEKRTYERTREYYSSEHWRKWDKQIAEAKEKYKNGEIDINTIEETFLFVKQEVDKLMEEAFKSTSELCKNLKGISYGNGWPWDHIE